MNSAQSSGPAKAGGYERRTPSLWPSALRVFDLALGEMLWSRRTIFMALIVGGPVVIALITRMIYSFGFLRFDVNGVSIAGPAMFGLIVWVFYLRFTIPVLGVFYGTALIADEVEDKTITYLFSRPIPRGAVLVGKYLAFLACTAFVVLPSVMLVYLLVTTIKSPGGLGTSFVPLLTDLGILFVGLAVYGALFAFVGAQLKRPLVIGLVFVIGWEPAALLIPGYMKRLTIAYYLQALVPHAMPQEGPTALLQAIFREVPSTASSLAALFVIWAVMLLLAGRAVENREYVLEQ